MRYSCDACGASRHCNIHIVTYRIVYIFWDFGVNIIYTYYIYYIAGKQLEGGVFLNVINYNIQKSKKIYNPFFSLFTVFKMYFVGIFKIHMPPHIGAIKGV